MDLRQLRYFIGVAERGGFGAAASALNIAQSALSRHIKELEYELGGALLTRTARGVAVTESGKVLLERGRWLLGMVDDIKAEVRTENREPSGTVRLGAPPSLGEVFYPALARLVVERFPRVQLELSEGLTELASDRLLRGQLDLAMVTAPQPNDHLNFETLVIEQVFLIGPPRDPLLQKGRLTRRDFSALPAAVRPLSRNPFPDGVPSSLRVDGATPMKRIAGWANQEHLLDHQCLIIKMVVWLRHRDDADIELGAEQAIAQRFGEAFAHFKPHPRKPLDKDFRKRRIHDVGEARGRAQPNRARWFAVLGAHLGLDVVDRAQQPAAAREQ